MSGPPGDEQQPQQPEWQQPQQQPEWQQPQPQQQPQWQQPQQSQPQWGEGGGGGFQPQTTPGSATAALILGICAILVCPIICAPLALVYGNKARKEIDGSGGRLGGRGMATAGIVLGWIGVALAVISIIWVIAVAASG